MNEKLRMTANLFQMIFSPSGYLKVVGWRNSFRRGVPCDRQNKILPWMNYSFIRFIAGRLNKQMILFEYGSGYSTEFWGSLVKKVYAVEHNQKWFEKVKKDLPENCELIYQKATGDLIYSQVSTRVAKQKMEKFDIIVIDGVQRDHCLMNCYPALKEDGVIIFDDVQEPHIRQGYKLLEDHGFRKIIFEGVKALSSTFYQTAVFYRDKNCLGI